MASDTERSALGRIGRDRRRLLFALVATVAVAALAVWLVRSGVVAVPEETTAVARTYLQRYGLLALFAIMIVEGAMLLYFAPSESLVPAAVLLLADSAVDVWTIVAVAVAGATVGQVALFAVARRAGRDRILEHPWLAIDEGRLDRFDAWFDRWGPIVVPVSNTMLFTRGMLTIPAGLSEMDVRTFAVLSAVGTLSFQAILAGVTLGALAWLG